MSLSVFLDKFGSLSFAKGSFAHFFQTIAIQGYTGIVTFLKKVLEFLESPLDAYTNLFLINDYNANTAIGKWLINIWNSLQQGGTNILDATWGNLLKALGFDITIPMWQLIISNIGLILGFLIVVKLIDLFN